jgi:hypothetical protein
MSGGKGGTQTTTVQLPEVLERAARENLAMADQVGRLGYMPYLGPTVAGLSPGQRGATANTNQAAQAFGLPQAGNPDSYMIGEAFNNGSAYGAAPLYRAGVGALTPQQNEAILGFLNPALRASAAQLAGLDPSQLNLSGGTGSKGGKTAGSVFRNALRSGQGRLNFNGGGDYSVGELAAMSGAASGGGFNYQDTYDRQMSQYTNNPGISVGYGTTAGQAVSNAR